MNDKTRLTSTDRKLRRSGYGSLLTTDYPPIKIHDEPFHVDMSSVGMQQEANSRLRYRRITSRSVCLPKEVWYRRIRIPGVYNRTSPHSNAVHTTKYTIINFLPKNLWEQFHRFANIYFLFIALLNFVPEVEAFGKEIGYIPLLFVLSTTAIKDIFEDYRRYRSDREVNSKLCRVYDWEMEAYVQRQWKDVHVGDCVELESDEFIPADLLLLATSDPNSICYIETANIDGETNLKQRAVVQGIVDNNQTLGPMDHFDPGSFSGELFAEQPHAKIYQFNGYVDVKGERRLGVDRNNLLLRGCVLRNTTRVAGLVVYAGHQTKALLNNSGPKAKRSKLEKDINIEIVFQLGLLLTLCIIGAIGSSIWTRLNIDRNITYFPYDSGDLDPALEGFIRFWTYLIIYQVIIPVSLYVTIEVVKFIQVYFLNWDLDMYYEAGDRPFECRALNITEDLGQIQYVFSDKTGTLTENVMVFRCCSIGGKNYLHTMSVNKNEIDNISHTEDHDETDFPTAPTSPLLLDVNLVNDITNSSLNDTSYIQDFFIVMALCNTVVLSRRCQDKRNVPDFSTPGEWNEERLTEYIPTITYEAESPDEAALVEAARSYGYALLSRSPNKAVISTPSHTLLIYDILHILEFDTERKCMSIIVKEHWSGQILLYSKGADSTIFSNLANPDTGILDSDIIEESVVGGIRERRRELTELHLTLYAKEGLRTLCMAKRVLNPADYADWIDQRRAAEVALENRTEKLFASACAIESKLELLGATGIEDRLQDGVPETIEGLRMAGIKVWVLTGDKQETAINVGFSSRLISENMDLIKINASSLEETREILECRMKEFDTSNDSSPDVSVDSRISSYPLTIVLNKLSGLKKHTEKESRENNMERRAKALVIDGGTLQFVVDPSLKPLFISIAKKCVSVICSRATPIQKASIVNVVKCDMKQMTLAVGDGANDVSMIQSANIGVGIAGKEGMQAVMASDFAMGRFYFLERLLLVHGHWSYSRLARMMLYFFYKNIAYAMLLFWWQLFNAWSGSNPIDGINLTIFNLVYTSLPIMVVGVGCQDLPASTLLREKHYYAQGRLSTLYTHWKFALTVIDALYQSATVFFLAYGVYNESDIGVTEFGFVINTVIVVVVSFHLAVETLHWTVAHHIFLWGSIVVLFVFNYIYTAIDSQQEFMDTYWIMFAASARPQFWFLLLLTPVVCLLPRVIGKVVEQEFFPTDILKARASEKKSTSKTPAAPTEETSSTSNSARTSFHENQTSLPTIPTIS